MRLSDSLSSSPSRVGVIALGVLLLAVALALGTSQVGAQVTPPSTPTYTATIIDCVTGNNQFYISSEQKYHWYVNNTLTTDDGAGSNTGVGCDSYQNDRYERPIGQTLLSYDDNIVPDVYKRQVLNRPSLRSLGRKRVVMRTSPSENLVMNGWWVLSCRPRWKS